MCFLLFSCPSSERELLRHGGNGASPTRAKSSLRSGSAGAATCAWKIKTQDEILAGEARPRRAFSRTYSRANSNRMMEPDYVYDKWSPGGRASPLSILLKAIHAKVKVHSSVQQWARQHLQPTQAKAEGVRLTHSRACISSTRRTGPGQWVRVSRSHVQNRNRMNASSHANPFQRAALRVLDADHAILGAVKRRRAA